LPTHKKIQAYKEGIVEKQKETTNQKKEDDKRMEPRRMIRSLIETHLFALALALAVAVAVAALVLPVRAIQFALVFCELLACVIITHKKEKQRVKNQ